MGIKYDVAYILGGRERFVDCVFVSLHNENGEGSFEVGVDVNVVTKEEEVGKGGLRGSGGSGRRSGRVSGISLESNGSKVVDVRLVSKRASRRISQQALVATNLDVVKGEGGRGMKRKPDDDCTEEDAKKTKTNPKKNTKRNKVMKKEPNVIQSKGKASTNRSKQSRKRKASPPPTTTTTSNTGGNTKKPRRNAKAAAAKSRLNATTKSRKKAIPTKSVTKQSTINYTITESELYQLSKDRCDSFLSGRSAGGSGVDNVVQVVTSGLSEYDENMVKLLCTELRGMDGTYACVFDSDYSFLADMLDN